MTRKEYGLSLALGLLIASPAMSSKWDSDGQSSSQTPSPWNLTCGQINGTAGILTAWGTGGGGSNVINSTNGVVGANWNGTQEQACPIDNPAPSGSVSLVHKWKRGSGHGAVTVALTTTPVASGTAMEATPGPWQWSPVITITDNKPTIAGTDRYGNPTTVTLDDTADAYDPVNMNGTGGTPLPPPTPPPYTGNMTVPAGTPAAPAGTSGNLPSPPNLPTQDGNDATAMSATTGDIGAPHKKLVITYTTQLSIVTEAASNARVTNWRIATQSTMISSTSN